MKMTDELKNFTDHSGDFARSVDKKIGINPTFSVRQWLIKLFDFYIIQRFQYQWLNTKAQRELVFSLLDLKKKQLKKYEKRYYSQGKKIVAKRTKVEDLNLRSPEIVSYSYFKNCLNDHKINILTLFYLEAIHGSIWIHSNDKDQCWNLLKTTKAKDIFLSLFR